MDLFEGEIYFFSDSSTKTGKLSAPKFQDTHDTLLCDSTQPKTTVHGFEYNIIWDLVSGTHGLTMMHKLKKIIDEKYDGDPQKFKGRAVFFCSLNDLDIWAKSRDEPMPTLFIHKAKEIRDYLKLFEVGRVIWLGPGSEKIWGYDGQNQIWDPWAEMFMDIIAESGILIFKGRHALSGRHLVDLPARRALAVHVAAVDGLELHVVGHARVDEDLDQLAARHDELGHHVDGVVPQLAELRLACGG